MINTKLIQEALDRNKEMLEALKARRGEDAMFIVRKAAEALVLARMAVPPEKFFTLPMAHKISSTFVTEASVCMMQVGMAAYKPGYYSLSVAEADKVSTEFIEEVNCMASAVMSILQDAGKAGVFRG